MPFSLDGFRCGVVLLAVTIIAGAAHAQAPVPLVPQARPQQSQPQAKPPSTPERKTNDVTLRSTPVVSSAQPLSPQQTATLQKVSTAFNAMHDMQATFTQVEFDGARATGRFFLTKPGRVRFQYDRPSPLEIVADGSDLVVRDRKLNTQDFYPLKQTPLRYLLNERIDLTKDAKVLAVLQDNDLVTVVIEDRNDFSQGQLTLFFDAHSYELRQWSVIDSNGRETAVAIHNVALNRPNNPELFKIYVLPGIGPQ
ncbi:LolA family protein [Candidatus Raskinella chloraquaticus]|uniref:Outer membrane lipoprotein carrier protein LolA n=1 Tax=Candidatus Raskinella chloraquaticus TaxID=1951219 RepID=A0A1W9HYM6_9HYPH|nr:MAG: hypothetical protein A4S15_06705 [Proteobacteria bacterium SG_bin8]